jgi:hypothetical protein
VPSLRNMERPVWIFIMLLLSGQRGLCVARKKDALGSVNGECKCGVTCGSGCDQSGSKLERL